MNQRGQSNSNPNISFYSIMIYHILSKVCVGYQATYIYVCFLMYTIRFLDIDIVL